MIKDELRKGNSAITEHGKTEISRVGGGLEEGIISVQQTIVLALGGNAILRRAKEEPQRTSLRMSRQHAKASHAWSNTVIG